jgi:hypothetical protein
LLAGEANWQGKPSEILTADGRRYKADGREEEIEVFPFLFHIPSAIRVYLSSSAVKKIQIQTPLTLVALLLATRDRNFQC